MTQVIVLGMHRSGTSMIAGCLHKMGIHMGDDLVLGNTKEQPAGYYEDREILHLNENILTAIEGDWINPPSFEKILQIGKKFNEEIIELIERRKPHKFWGWKDPRTCLTLPAWLPHLSNPKIIVANRGKAQVIASLVVREKGRMDEEKAGELHNHYIEAIIRYADKFAIVYYEDFIRNPDVERLARYIGYEPASGQLQAAKDHVRPELNRHPSRQYA